MPATALTAQQPILFAALVLLLWFAPALLAAHYARKTGLSLWRFLLVGVFLGWPIALVAAAVRARRTVGGALNETRPG